MTNNEKTKQNIFKAILDRFLEEDMSKMIQTQSSEVKHAQI